WGALARLQQVFFRGRERLASLREPRDRVEAHRDLVAHVLDALGYTVHACHRAVAAGSLPLLGAVDRRDGSPLVWFLPAVGAHGQDEDVLARALLVEQHDLV